jgi:hypothetical protein
MLQEFAIDPTALSTWQSYRYIVEKFGVEHGRLIAAYPRYWQTLVRQATLACKDYDRKKIEVDLINNIKYKLLDRRRPYGNAPTWLQNAEAEHLRETFRAIIASSNPRNQDFVRVLDELNEDDACLVTVREQVIARTVGAMAACVERLFEGSKEFLLVDPHFNPDREGFRLTLREFVRIATRNGSRLCKIEFHLGIKCPIDDFRRNCERFLMRSLPRGAIVTFIRWDQIDQGDHLHPRYILTDIGGLHFESGLDAGDPGETTDVRLLTSRLHIQRWNDYQTSASTTRGLSYVERLNFRTTFKLVDRIQLIGGRSVKCL